MRVITGVSLGFAKTAALATDIRKSAGRQVSL
jgi:hypothetical protein